MPKKIDKSRSDVVIHLYKKGFGPKYISDKVGISRQTVFDILKRENEYLKDGFRPFKNTYDISFFNSYNKESCYWSGFILADGNLRTGRKCLQIGLKKDDIGHLQKFSDAIKFAGTIYKDIRKNGYKAVKLCVSGKWLCDDLNNNFDIYSKKSLTAKFTNKIPEEFLPDFIRGYFDGDGCIAIDKRDSSVILSLVGTNNVLNSISVIFDKKISIITKVKKIKNAKIYEIRCQGEKAKKILDWIYSKSNIQTRLDRKYNLYEEFVKKKIL